MIGGRIGMFGIYTRTLFTLKSLYYFSLCSYYKFLHLQGTFKFNGEEFSYFIHSYNFTWRNERTIEIPIIRRVVSDNAGKDILEIGNVLSHYFNISHDVLDKYEKDNKVINEDIVDFKSKKKYDLIISISTLEHIGWDESVKDSQKVFRAIKKMKSFLKKKGKIMITIPLGYNSIIDQNIKNNQLYFSEKFLLIRTSKKNTWRQSPWSLIKNIKYNDPFPYANGVVLGIINNLND